MNQRNKVIVGCLITLVSFSLSPKPSSLPATSTEEITITIPIETSSRIENSPKSISRASYIPIAASPIPTLIPSPIPTLIPSPTPTLIPSPTPTLPQYIVKVTAAEKELFIKIVAAEAGSDWELEGYWLIAQTVINQLNNGYWGDTLQEVLTYKGNYSVYANDWYKKQPKAKLDKSCKAVEMVLTGQSPKDLHISIKTAKSILYFCTTAHLKNNPSGFHATKCTKVTVYDNVTFFK